MRQSDKQKIAISFGRAAKSYDDNALLQEIVAGELFALANDIIKPDDKIIDVGAGTGFFKKMLDHHNLKNKLVHLDISEEMCKIAKDKYGDKNTDFICADMDKIPLPDNSIDIVFSSLALQWSGDIKRTIKELKRVLKPDGIALLSIIVNGSLAELKKSYEYLDRKKSVNEFTDANIFKGILRNYFTILSFRQKSFKFRYDDIISLLKNIKSIGANYKLAGKNSFAGRDFFNKLQQYYLDEFSEDGKLPVKWEIVFCVVKK